MDQIDSMPYDWVTQVRQTLNGPSESGYYLEHLAVEKVLDEHELEMAGYARLVAQFAAEGKGMPAFKTLIESRQSTVASDAKWVDLLRKEIRSYKGYVETPPELREQYYRENIQQSVQNRLEYERQLQKDQQNAPGSAN
jgi:hypothetical protein